MLNSILSATICVQDLHIFESAYRDHLHYETIHRGRISGELASIWGSPNTAGTAYLLMRPESGAPVYIRAVQARGEPFDAPKRPLGWGAIEILVQSPDQLEKKLAESPFQVIGSPRSLSSHESIRSMQAIGPGRELIYFTQIPADCEDFNLLPATTEVDRIFVVSVGVRDLEAARKQYRKLLGMDATPPVRMRISSLSKAYGLAPETLHEVSVFVLPEACLIELNQYPPQATSWNLSPGTIPPGLAAVTFTTETLGNFSSRAIRLSEKPYEGRRIAVFRGPEGEIIELVES